MEENPVLKDPHAGTSQILQDGEILHHKTADDGHERLPGDGQMTARWRRRRPRAPGHAAIGTMSTSRELKTRSYGAPH